MLRTRMYNVTKSGSVTPGTFVVDTLSAKYENVWKRDLFMEKLLLRMKMDGN